MAVVRGEGCPRPLFLLVADWLMLLSGHMVPREDEEPCVICGGFYKQRRSWKWWDEILAKGRNEKSIRNAFPFSPLFFLPLSVFRRTAAAITPLYISSFNLTYTHRAPRLSDKFQGLGCEKGEYHCQNNRTWRLSGANSSKTPSHAPYNTVKRTMSSWQMNSSLQCLKEEQC